MKITSAIKVSIIGFAVVTNLALAADQRPNFLCEYKSKTGQEMTFLINPSGTRSGSDAYDLWDLDMKETKVEKLSNGKLKLEYHLGNPPYVDYAADPNPTHFDFIFDQTWYRNDKHSFHATFYFRYGAWSTDPASASIFIDKKNGKGEIKSTQLKERNYLKGNTYEKHSMKLTNCQEVESIVWDAPDAEKTEEVVDTQRAPASTLVKNEEDAGTAEKGSVSIKSK